MPPHEDGPGRAPVTAADVTLAVRLAAAALGLRAGAKRGANQAGSLEWDCWETVEHIADDLFAYATQLTPATPEGGYVPIAMTSTRPGGAESAIHVDRENGTGRPAAGAGGVRRPAGGHGHDRSPGTRAWHPHGTSDPEGFAAMGVTEILVHGHDAAQGLGVPWEPPADLCARVLSRLFPGAPADAPAWAALLWATGRGDLPGRPRLGDWRWYSEPQR